MASKLDTAHVRNVGEFYSQHYLDAVLADDLEEVLARWSTRESEGGPKAPYKRLASLAEPYFKALADYATEDDPERRPRLCAEFHASLLDALGYTREPSRTLLPGDLDLPRTVALDHQGKPYLWIVEAPFPTSEDDADPLGTPPLDPGRDPASPPLPTWRELLGGPLLRQEHAPRWVVLLAGPDAFLIDRDKWPFGQYLHFELGAMLGHRKPAALRAVAALLHREVLLPDGGQSLLDRLDEKSHKHAFAVSTDLKLGVQRAIELIGDEAVHYKREVSREKVFDRPELAAELSRECITYLYRLLFLFYVEARGGEVGVVPMKAEAYRHGLSLESLRDLELVPLTTDRARNGYFIHHSLEKLFEVVHLGWPHSRQRSLDSQLSTAVDLVVPPQRSPLFDRARTPILSSVKLRNFVLQQVIALLSLSKEGSRSGGQRQRGRISYAQLGINQLGAVYEGLLSYTGFFAQEDTYEIQSEGDEGDARVFYVPRSRAGDYEDAEFRKTDSGAKIVHPKGSFLFRLAGRDREKSASYYTPEVLTRCLTKYTLKERLGEPGSPEALSADQILDLTICEPAMGSGAFLNEAVSQLAHAYLERKQAELGQTIPAEDYQKELARVKYHFVNHRCYGVDLNPLAAELGKVSLWLSVLQPEVQAPFLDLRIRVGNSLIGARREVYAPADLTQKPNKKAGTTNWLGKPPTRVPPGEPRPEGSVYHFLLPDEGMSPYESDKVVAELCPKEIAALKAWRKSICQPFTPMEVKRLQALSDAIDALWDQHRSAREKALEQARQPIALWGQPSPSPSPGGQAPRWKTVEECEPIAHDLFSQKRSTAGARLKAVMDYWCSLWLWPVEHIRELPNRETWIESLESRLERGRTPDEARSNERRFLHWDLEFPEIFRTVRGGFDLILGNPPWIKLIWQEAGILSDLDPRLAVRGLGAKEIAEECARVTRNSGARAAYLREFVESVGTQSFLAAATNFPLLQGIQANLYKCFIVTGMRLAAERSGTGFFHQTGLYDDPKARLLRNALLQRLTLHVHFINKLLLFPDIEDQKHYEISVLRGFPGPVKFKNMSNVLHPSSLDGSHTHDGIGPTPGLKDEAGRWDIRPHRSRIVHVDEEILQLFARLYDAPGTPAVDARLPIIHSQEILLVLHRLADAPAKLTSLEKGYFCSECFHETNQQKDGTIQKGTQFAKNINRLVISGPHFHAGTPFSKTPNEGCKHSQDYTPLDLTQVSENYLPRTNFTPACSTAEYRKRLPHWEQSLYTDFYRHVHREMVGPTSERTLIPAILAPGASHVNTVYGIAFASEYQLLCYSGMAHSIAADFFVKSTGMSHVNRTLSEQLPCATGPTIPAIHTRTLQLNCLTVHYADLWNRNLPKKKDLLPSAKADDPRSAGRCAGWEKVPRTWCWEAPLRTPYARRQALVELDALAALSLEMTLDELLLIYQIQFPILQQYERETYYDRRGKIVFTVNKGLSGVGLERKQWEQIKDAKAGDRLPEWAVDAGGAFVPPFDCCDREEDMAQAYAYFKERLGDA